MDQGEEKRKLYPGWKTVRLLGRGSFGAVYEIERQLLGKTERAALKVISIPQDGADVEELYSSGYDRESVAQYFRNQLENVVQEYYLMAEMKGHTNVVYCEDILTQPHEDGLGYDVLIKMELLTPLLRMLNQRERSAEDDEELALRLGTDICRALVLCRQRNIVHRDIKLQNIFVSENGDFKLGDFGIARTMEHTSGATKIGTYNYMAPEVYNNQPYGSSADIYSLGMVLYWLLNERRGPFLPAAPQMPTVQDNENARVRRFGGEVLPEPRHGSEALKKAVLKACAFRPEDRYASAEEMLAVLESLQEEQEEQERREQAQKEEKERREREAREQARREQEERERREQAQKEEQERREREAREQARWEQEEQERREQAQKEEKERREREAREQARAAQDQSGEKPKKTPLILGAVGLAAVLAVVLIAAGLKKGGPEPAAEPAAAGTTAVEPAAGAQEQEPMVITGLKAGDEITFGAYEQDGDPGNGAEPVTWRVLEVQNDQALILSEYILDWLPYSGGTSFQHWRDSSLREWLNGEFYETAFNESEKAIVIETEDPWLDDSADRVRLLTSAEASAARLFAGDEQRKATATAYAAAKFREETDELTEEQRQGQWWLSDYGDSGWENVVRGDGFARWLSKADAERGVRPALWLRLGEAPQSQLLQRRRDGSVWATVDYDPENGGQLKEVGFYSEEGEKTDSFRFSFDEDNKISRIEKLSGTGELLTSHSYSYTGGLLAVDDRSSGGERRQFSLVPAEYYVKTDNGESYLYNDEIYFLQPREPWSAEGELQWGENELLVTFSRSGELESFNLGCDLRPGYEGTEQTDFYAAYQVFLTYDSACTCTQVSVRKEDEKGRVTYLYERDADRNSVLTGLEKSDPFDSDREVTETGIVQETSIVHRYFHEISGGLISLGFDPSQGNRIENLVRYDADRKIDFYYLFEYGENNSVTKITRYDGTGRALHSFEYTYAPDGQAEFTTWYQLRDEGGTPAGYSGQTEPFSDYQLGRTDMLWHSETDYWSQMEVSTNNSGTRWGTICIYAVGDPYEKAAVSFRMDGTLYDFTLGSVYDENQARFLFDDDLEILTGDIKNDEPENEDVFGENIESVRR